MKKRFDQISEKEKLREKIIGLGNSSTRKNYYPELQRQVSELKRFKALIDQSNDFIFLTEIPSGRITYVNASACIRLQLNKTAIVKKNLQDLIPHSGYRQIRRLITNGSHQILDGTRIITVLKKGDQADIPVELSVQRVIFQNTIYGIVIARDITERELARDLTDKINLLENVNQQLNYRIELEALVSGLSTRFIEASYEKTDETIRWGLKTIGRFLRIDRCYMFQFTKENNRFSTTYAWTGEGGIETLKKWINMPISCMGENLSKLRANQVVELYDLHLTSEAGIKNRLKQVGIKSTLFAPLIYDNQLVGVMGSDSKERRRKWRPEEIRLIRITSEMILNILKRKEMEDDLKHAKMAAEEANQVKSIFLANMSHEIRTPMNAIIGLSHLALKTELTSRQSEYVTSIESSAQLLLGIINDILDISKIESGKLALENIAFDLEALLNRIANLINIKAEEKGLELIFSIDRKVPINLCGDPLRLGQVLTNLANNAVKFTETGQIIIKIEQVEKSLQRSSEQTWIQFSVQDSGIGMTSKQVGNLFKPFSQADSTITRKFGGTGLGLTISRNLVQLMGGELVVHSQYGRGSTFQFILGFEPGPPTQAKKKIEYEYLKGIRVLIVDDNAVSRQILVELMNSFNFDVHSVASGPEAFAEIEKSALSKPYQMLFIDWKMPEMNGLKTALRIKSFVALKHIPIVLMVNAHALEEIKPHASEAGIDAFLSKPVTPSGMLESIMAIFGKLPEITPLKIQRSHVVTGLEHLGGSTVLLVEDNEINRLLTVELLSEANIEVTSAANGDEALKRLDESEFEAVLMDINMPVKDGLTTTKAIRNNPKWRDLPIIAMTAHAITGYREKCLAVGMNDYVTKPIDTQELFNVLAKWINPKQRDPDLNEIHRNESVDPDQQPAYTTGFDLSLGLSRVAGQAQVYLNLLTTLRQNQQEVIHNIEKAFQANDLDQIKDLAHSLKGSAGNLGATDLYHASVELEKTLKTNQWGKIREQFDLLRKAAEKTNHKIEALQTYSGFTELSIDSKIPQDIDINQVKRFLDKMSELLRYDYSKGLKQIRQAFPLFENTPMANDFETLIQYIENFDEEDAFNLINQIQARLRV